MELIECDDVLFPVKIASNPLENLKTVKEMKYRDGDVLICSYPKSGYHWTESLIRSLLRSKENENILSQSNLIDFRTEEQIKAMAFPRVLCTHLYPKHLPVDHVEKFGKIVLLLRNPKDVAVSGYHHFNRSRTASRSTTWDQYFEEYIRGRVPYSGVFTYMLKWQEALESNKFNIQFFFFEDFKKNEIENLQRLAEHLGVSKTRQEIQDIVEECSIESLRNKEKLMPVPEGLRDKNNESLIYRKGEIGDWKNHFTVAQNERFERRMQEEMKQIKFQFQFE